MTADVLTWLTGTLASLEQEWRADDHGDECGWLPDVDPPDDEDDLCSCGLVNRRRWALAAIDADRAILAEHQPSGRGVPRQWQVCLRCVVAMDRIPDDWEAQRHPCRTVLLVASRYRHHPGYLEAWAPTS